VNACRVMTMKTTRTNEPPEKSNSNSGGTEFLQSLNVNVDDLFKNIKQQVFDSLDGFVQTNGGMYHVTTKPNSGKPFFEDYNAYYADGQLAYINNRKLLQQVIRNMIRHTSSPLGEHFELSEDDYQFLMDVIYEQFLKVVERRASQTQEEEQPIEHNVVNVSFMDTLVHALTSIEGIASVQTLFMDYPRQVSILLRVDPEFELRDPSHAEQWEQRIANAIRFNKPKALDKLEVVFHRMEVF